MDVCHSRNEESQIPTDMIKCLSVLAILLLSSCAAPIPDCRQTVATSLQVYFDAQGIPFVLAGLGATPAAMLVDTGAETTAVSHELATEAGLSEGTFAQTFTVVSAGAPVPAYFATEKRFFLGNAFSNNMKILVFAKPISPWAFGEKSGIDGSLGNDIWRNYDLDLNFPDAAVTLFDKQSCATLPMSWLGNVSVVPITIDYYGYVFVPVTVDGHRFNALLDTGTSVSTLPALAIASSGLSSDESAPLQNLNVATVGGTIPSTLYGFKEMVIGNEKIEKPVFAVARMNKIQMLAASLFSSMGQRDPFMKYNPYEDVVLGENFIRAHRMFISYPTSTLYIQN
jgi:predicted aspartyl protease